VPAGDASRTTNAASQTHHRVETGSDERVAHQQRIEIRLRITRVKKPDEVSEPMGQHPLFLKMGKHYLDTREQK
jgi:hypothetical protein